jgi:hypothetical protein
MRALVIALGLMLSACSSSPDLAIPAYVTPSAPSPDAITKGARQAAAEEKLKSPLEISDVRHNEHGLGTYFVCLREADPSTPKRRTYAVFYDNDAYKGVRESVLMENCGTQSYAALPEGTPAPAPTPTPTPTPSSTRHHKRQ